MFVGAGVTVIVDVPQRTYRGLLDASRGVQKRVPQFHPPAPPQHTTQVGEEYVTVSRFGNVWYSKGNQS